MVKRYDDALEVSVYKFDLFPPLDWGDDIEEELRKQVALWNKLCEIERVYVTAMRTVADPASAELETQIAPLVERFDTANDERRAKRKEAKKKLPTPELDAEIEDLHSRIKTLRTAAKEKRKTAYADNKDALRDLELDRRAQVKDAYQNSGLFWGNYNAIIAAYERSRGRALSQGRELRPQVYTGEGRLTNQIQGGMLAARLLAGTHSQAALLPKPEWMRASHHIKSGTTPHKKGYTLKVSVNTRTVTPEPTEDNPTPKKKHERRTVSFPFIMYRPLPEDALIKEVVVTRRKHADRFVYAVIFTVTQAKQNKELPTGMPVAINLGWRKVEDEGGEALRVATAVQVKTRSRLKPEFEDASHTEISGRLMSLFETYENVQSERDNAKNLLVAKLREIDYAHPALFEFWSELSSTNARISAGFLIRLHRAWKAACPEWQRLLLDDLGEWYYGTGRRQDPDWKTKIRLPSERVKMFGERGIHREQANRRRRFDNARLYFYRAEARRLVGNASLVVLNSHNMADTARKDSGLPPGARRQRFIAAPSILRQTITNYCKKNNIEIQTYKGIGRIHWRCQLEFHPALPDELRQVCLHCHETFDTDVNFCHMMLTRTFAPQHAQAA